MTIMKHLLFAVSPDLQKSHFLSANRHKSHPPRYVRDPIRQFCHTALSLTDGALSQFLCNSGFPGLLRPAFGCVGDFVFESFYGISAAFFNLCRVIFL